MTEKVYILAETDDKYFMFPNAEPDSSLQKQLFDFVVDKQALTTGDRVIGVSCYYDVGCWFSFLPQPIYKNSLIYPLIIKAIKDFT